MTEDYLTRSGAGGATEDFLARAVEVLRGMAYEHRLHILILLRDRGELTPAALTESIAADPTAVAHHLRFLLDARLIRRERRGRNVFYALRGEATDRLLAEVLHYVSTRS